MKNASPIDQIRSYVRIPVKGIASGLNKISGGRITPNTITFLSLLGHVPVAYLIVRGDLSMAALFLVVFGLMDTLDGELARLQKRASNKGMFLDSVTDRAKEVLLYISAGFFFVRHDDPYAAVWAIAACGIAVTVSYINAWGEVATADLPKNHTRNKTYRNGIMTYDVRMFVIVTGLLTSMLDVAVATIAVLSVFTALQRFANVYRRLA